MTVNMPNFFGVCLGRYHSFDARFFWSCPVSQRGTVSRADSSRLSVLIPRITSARFHLGSVIKHFASARFQLCSVIPGFASARFQCWSVIHHFANAPFQLPSVIPSLASARFQR